MGGFFPELFHFPYRPVKGSEKGSEKKPSETPEKQDFAYEVLFQVLFCIEVLFLVFSFQETGGDDRQEADAIAGRDVW